MCCCDKSNVNGTPGYKWQPNDPPSIHPVAPPALLKDETLIFDAPGRCVKGEGDCHSHHYRVTRANRIYWLVVQHGGGTERFALALRPSLYEAWIDLDYTERYWTFHALYYAHRDAANTARLVERSDWMTAAAEKRIRTRKQRGTDQIKVWIEPKKGA